VYTAAWPTNANGSLPMGPLDAGVVKFTTGSVAGSGQIQMTNAPSGNATTTHDYVLSTQPCDFTGVKRMLGAGTGTFRFSVSTGTVTCCRIRRTTSISVTTTSPVAWPMGDLRHLPDKSVRARTSGPIG
jgi:hypothetical protein